MLDSKLIYECQIQLRMDPDTAVVRNRDSSNPITS